MNVNLPQFIRFGRETCNDLVQAERREWWLTNQLGGYAAGTIAGTLTRRYHGLLTAPINPPLGRFLVFAKADATFHDGQREWPLFSNRWNNGSVSPQGYIHIESFYLDGRMPVWRFAVGDVLIEMRIWMEQHAHTTYVAYRLQPRGVLPNHDMKLRVKLLVNARDHHGTAKVWDFNPNIEQRNGSQLQVQFPNWFNFYIKTQRGQIHTDHTWYENFYLSEEQARGLSDTDNHLCVGEAEFELDSDEWSGLIISLDRDASPYLVEAMRRFTAHDHGVLARAKVQHQEFIEAPQWVQQMLLAADGFIFSRPLPEIANGESVIAGYPWFGDWGRDTMIALPGLTLVSARYESALRILETFARFIDQGMLPNVFPGNGQVPEYNTVDAALWYIEAWRAYIEATKDHTALAKVFPVLEEIIDWHCRGTRYGIKLDSHDGLLCAGEAGVQLTWMDAKIGDWVVTPRTGKPVEINALWFNALCVMHDFAKHLKKPSNKYEVLAKVTKSGFKRFIKNEGGLFDVIDSPEGDDASIRPNQIFAVSLEYSPLEKSQQQKIVAQCARELLGSYGLRSLASTDPRYQAVYSGGVWERDSAYHQGPLWTWLLGHYALAVYRTYGDPARAQACLEPLSDHLFDAALGTVSEIFDGSPPHYPRGAPSQAWSVACTLQAWWYLQHVKRLATKATLENVVRIQAS